MSRKERTIRFYSFKISGDNSPEFYENVFHEAVELTRNEGFRAAPDYVIASEQNRQFIFNLDEGGVFRFFGGDPQAEPVVYDANDGTSQPVSLGNGKWLVTDTLVYFRVTEKQRIIGIESKRNGITKRILERLLDAATGKIRENADVGLTPVASADFEKSILEFETIRKFSIVAQRPNPSFNDYATTLARHAASANAEKIGIDATAPRGESLDKESSYITESLAMTKAPGGMVENVKVTGKKPGDERERTESLKNNQERTRYRYDSNSGIGDRIMSFTRRCIPVVNNIISRRSS